MGAKGQGQGRRYVWDVLSLGSYEALRKLHPELGRRFEGKDISGHSRGKKAAKRLAASQSVRAHNAALPAGGYLPGQASFAPGGGRQGGYGPGAAIAAKSARGGRGTRLLY